MSMFCVLVIKLSSARIDRLPVRYLHNPLFVTLTSLTQTLPKEWPLHRVQVLLHTVARYLFILFREDELQSLLRRT